MLHPEALERVLSAIPADVWAKLWFAESTTRLRSASKALRLVVDGMLPKLPASAHMSDAWWFSDARLPGPTKWAVVLDRVLALAARSSVTRLELLCTSQALGLQAVLERCPQLQHLSISSVGRLGCVGAAVIARGLTPCTALTHLNLRRNDMGATGVRSLLPTMRTSVHLQHLDLGLNRLGSLGATLLAPLLLVLSALAHLDLSGNAIQGDGGMALGEYIGHCSALTLLDLGHNDMRTDGVAHLAEALPHCKRLVHFDVSNNRCTHVDALAHALAACPALAHLNVSYNSLSQHGVQRLAALLPAATALRSLHLVMCVRASYSHSLAVGLGMCTALTDLHLNYNSIGCPRAAEYALRLHLCRGLVLLDLRGNDIFNGGAQALAHCLRHYAALEQLVLPHNSIGFLGAAALLTHSSACPTLAALDLSHNVIGRARPAGVYDSLCIGREQPPSLAFARVLASAAKCTALRTLSLASNHMNDSEKRALHERWGPQRPGLLLL